MLSHFASNSVGRGERKTLSQSNFLASCVNDHFWITTLSLRLMNARWKEIKRRETKKKIINRIDPMSIFYERPQFFSAFYMRVCSRGEPRSESGSAREIVKKRRWSEESREKFRIAFNLKKEDFTISRLKQNNFSELLYQRSLHTPPSSVLPQLDFISSSAWVKKRFQINFIVWTLTDARRRRWRTYLSCNSNLPFFEICIEKAMKLFQIIQLQIVDSAEVTCSNFF